MPEIFAINPQKNVTCDEQLDDDQKTDTGSDISWISIHSSQHVYNSLHIEPIRKKDQQSTNS